MCSIENIREHGRCKNRIAIVFPRPAGGFFSHFAHFISDFALPFYSVFRKNNATSEMLQGRVTLEVKDELPMKFGPLLPLVHELFPYLNLEYTSRFTIDPVRIHRRPWHNDPADVDYFRDYLKALLPIKPFNYGVIIVSRGLNRDKYPGGNYFHRSGADRRAIIGGLETLIARVNEARRDTVCVVLDELSFADQVSLFLNADTLIGQHGAAFVHSHWMPKGGHLIELQCSNRKMCPGMVFALGRLRGHKVSVVNYNCQTHGNWAGMTIGDATKVSRLLTAQKDGNQLKKLNCSIGGANKVKES